MGFGESYETPHHRASLFWGRTAPQGHLSRQQPHDGHGLRGVYDELTRRGYRVSVVQDPLISLQGDVAATRRILARQDGPSILVGHSYGGTVITEAA